MVGFLQYQVKAEPVLATPETVTESRWHYPWSEPVRQKIDPKLAIALAASGLIYLEAPPFPEVISLDKWFVPWDSIVWPKRALAARYHQPFAFTPFTFAEPIYYDKWGFSWSEPVRLDLRKGLKYYLQSTTTMDGRFGIYPPVNKGYIIC